MKERPILFSAPMVRALLAGTKTQTRRIVKPQPMPDVEFVREHAPEVYGPGAFCAFRQDGRVFMHQRMAPCPYGQPGDRLWVKETWSTGARLDGMSPSEIERRCRDAGYTHGACCPVRYHADGRLTQWGDRDADDFGPQGKTRVSIHMPRWGSRLTLEITSVRVEHLRSISEADAIAEGVECFHGRFWQGFEGGPVQSNPVRAYRDLWESINGPESWEANPWVWVVEFRRADGNGESEIMDEGKLWSLIRNVLSQGGAIQLDRASMSEYEEYSARLDAAAAERVTDFAKLADAKITALQQIARLQTDLELARRDAARYRWLRDFDNEGPISAGKATAFSKYGFERVEWFYGDELDAAIDAARAGNGGEG